MKLIHYSLLYMSVALLFIIGIWATVFYFNMLDEVYDSIDDGLENSKVLIIQKVKEDSSLLNKHEFGESNYHIQRIPSALALQGKDLYKDTLMYSENEEDLEPVRLLVTTFKEGESYYQLKIISSMVEEDDLMEDLLYSILWLYLIIMISILIVNALVMRKIWTPFYHLITYLQSFRLEKENPVPLPDTKVTEFNQLQQAVSELLDRNLHTYNSQKQFIENASHELQTPLAIGINKLELLAEKAASEEQLTIVGDVIQVLERMTRLNQALLLLSKIENRQFATVQSVSFNALFRKYASDFEDLASFKQVRITFQEEAELVGEVNKDLAEILVSNLLKNAVVHNIPQGIVEVQLKSSGFTVVNTGADVALDGEKLFSRFYKTSVHKNTTGLGLSIVKAITDFSGAKISYRFHSGRHAMNVRFA